MSKPDEAELLCFSDVREGHTYFVYWLVAKQILGVSDLSEELYEANLDRKERTRFLKNIAESLVDGKWR